MQESQDIVVHGRDGDCPVVVRPGALDALGALAAPRVRGRAAAVVADSNTGPLYAARAAASLEAAGFRAAVREVPAGEGSKNVARLQELWEFFHGAGVARGDLVVALGGGVVGDLAGFAAATWMRGVAVVQVPTSLLAFVDSSIGGKTAVDLPAGKNLAGAFHQPVAVVADPLLLRTLPPREFSQGMAEVVKYGCIRDAAFFAWLEGRAGAPFADADVSRIVAVCAAHKAAVVSADEREGGLRAVLNFGHTVGHALEKVLGYGTVAHGEAVAAGMVAAARIGEALGRTEAGTAARIAALLARLSLPTRLGDLAPGVDRGGLLAATMSDKKRAGDAVRFVLLDRVGACSSVPLRPDEIAPVLASLP
ncbi:MAG: 3-dehydroquinate synthase [Kiritimatiellae bacterium]|nr:3-dehydroquinate synthase [Kiritimatiellia bacterium]